MLHVFSTVAQHPLGLRLHLDNLMWALGREFSIHIQSFRQWAFSDSRVDFILHDAPDGNPLQYFNFYGHLGPHILELVRDEDSVLFTQQDILFFRKVETLAQEAVRQGEVIVNFSVPYQYTIYSARFGWRRKYLWDFYRFPILYPRVWEGAALIPGSILRRAVSDGVSLGHKPAAFRPGKPLHERFADRLRQVYMTDQHANMRPVSDYLNSIEQRRSGPPNRYGHDTLLELSLFCFCFDVPFRFACSDPHRHESRELSDYAIHFHYPETVHRETDGAVYKHPELIGSVLPYRRRSASDIALMYYLSGAVDDLDKLKPFLTQWSGKRIFRRKLAALASTADQWMSTETAERFCRIRCVVK